MITQANDEQLLRARLAGDVNWLKAVILWLDTRRSPATRTAYARALEDLLSSSVIQPWEATRTHVLLWVQKMSRQGLAPATIRLRLAGVSSFYQFCATDYLINNEPLHTNNPAAGKSLRPKVEMYGKAAWLSTDEITALLKAIWRGGIQGRRDYALFLGYILLARRNSEWRQAKWGDFEQHGEQVILRWEGKGKIDQRLDVPLPVWTAVCDYLTAAGRIKTIQASDYIFTALSRLGRTLPGARVITDCSPLSSHEVGRLLRHYLHLAGLEGKRITPHSLRHSGAMLQRAAGASDQEIMKFLGHSNLAITQVYLHLLEGNQTSHWMRVSELLGLEL